MYLRLTIILLYAFIFNSFDLISFEASNRYKLKESDSIYFQDIDNLEYSPNLEFYVINQKSESNRINIFNKDGTLFKTYLIDDTYTFKFIDSINYNMTEVLMNNEEYEGTNGSKTKSEFTNTISQSSFLNDSTLVTIGSLKYLVHYHPVGGQPHFKLNRPTVLLFTNLINDEFQIKPLRFNETNVNPQSDYLEIVKNDIYFELFPAGFLRKIPNSPKTVVGKINLDDYDWEPLIDLPNEYVTSNIRLSIDFSYRIADYKNKTYFMSPLTNYLFNVEKDTIWLSDLDDPIEYSLSQFGSKTVSLPGDMYKLDSVSHSIVEFFFQNDFLYVILNTPKVKDGKIYLHKYSLKGEFINSKELNEGRKLESTFYTKNKQRLMKVYMENEEWYIEEVDIN